MRLLLAMTFTCGYLIGVNNGKKIFLEEMQQKSKDLLERLRVVPIGGCKEESSPFEDLMTKIRSSEKEDKN